MAEVGCLNDEHVQNLEVDGITNLNDFATNFTTSNALIINITRPGWTNIKNHKSEGKKNISNELFKELNDLTEKYEKSSLFIRT